jgi:hypothetical protein
MHIHEYIYIYIYIYTHTHRQVIWNYDLRQSQEGVSVFEKRRELVLLHGPDARLPKLTKLWLVSVILVFVGVYVASVTLHVCVYTHMYACMYMYMYMYIYAYIHTYIHAYMHVCIPPSKAPVLRLDTDAYIYSNIHACTQYGHVRVCTCTRLYTMRVCAHMCTVSTYACTHTHTCTQDERPGISLHHHIRMPERKDFARLGRHLAGRSIG